MAEALHSEMLLIDLLYNCRHLDFNSESLQLISLACKLERFPIGWRDSSPKNNISVIIEPFSHCFESSMTFYFSVEHKLFLTYNISVPVVQWNTHTDNKIV